MFYLDISKASLFVKFIFEEMGLSSEYAEMSSKVIMQAELTGVPTHGLAKLPFYVMRYQNQAENLTPNIKKLNSHKNNILLDGDNGSGLIVGPMALKRCISLTKKKGIATVAVRNSGHFGCGNYYAWEFAENNLIGVIMTNTAPLMAPYGGKEREIGTNPIAVAIPAKDNYPIVLDMATSVAAYGKIQIAAAANSKIPNTWVKNAEGIPTDNPIEGLDGTLQSIADYKGYGLAVIVDALTSLLSQGQFGQDVATMEALNKKVPEGVSHFMLGIDPSTFYPIEDFLAYVDKYINYMKESSKAVGTEEIFMPGEIEFKKTEEVKKKGIILTSEQDQRLFKMLDEIGVDLIGTSSLKEWIDSTF